MIRPRPAPARLLDALAPVTRQSSRPGHRHATMPELEACAACRAVARMAARRLIGKVGP